MRRAYARFAGIVVVALVAAACGSTPGASDAASDAPSGPPSSEGAGEPLDRVIVQLDWLPRGEHSIFFVAMDEGYFADNGIEVVEVRNGTGSGNTMRVIGANGAEFGFADLPTLAVARSQDLPVVALAAVTQRSPLAMVTIAANHPLKEPADLEGLTVGINPAASTYVFYQAFVALNDLDRDSITEQTVVPPSEQYLLQEQVDALPGYVNAEIPELENMAGGTGSLDILLGADYGYDAFGSGLLTSDRLIEQNPDLVSRFVEAYLKAFQFMLDNPEGAADALIAHRPEMEDKREVLITQINAQIPLATSPATEANGLGFMEPATWESTVNILSEQGVIETAPEVESLFNNSFH